MSRSLCEWMFRLLFDFWFSGTFGDSKGISCAFKLASSKLVVRVVDSTSSSWGDLLRFANSFERSLVYKSQWKSMWDSSSVTSRPMLVLHQSQISLITRYVLISTSFNLKVVGTDPKFGCTIAAWEAFAVIQVWLTGKFCFARMIVSEFWWSWFATFPALCEVFGDLINYIICSELAWFEWLSWPGVWKNIGRYGFTIWYWAVLRLSLYCTICCDMVKWVNFI